MIDAGPGFRQTTLARKCRWCGLKHALVETVETATGLFPRCLDREACRARVLTFREWFEMKWLIWEAT